MNDSHESRRPRPMLWITAVCLIRSEFMLGAISKRYFYLCCETAFFSFQPVLFPEHINGWESCNMIYGTVYVLCLPKAYRVNIWTLAWFNEQNFSEISPGLYSIGDLSGFVKALCCLLIGPRWAEEPQRQIHACAHTQTHRPQKRPLSSGPRGNDDSHHRLKARWPQSFYSAALLSYQTALLYWCSIISFALSFLVHQGVVVRLEWGWNSVKN